MRTIRAVIFLLCIVTSAAIPSNEGSPVDPILSQVQRYFRAIRSVQFSSTEKINLTDEGMQVFSASKNEYVNRMKFAEQTGNYRSEVTMETPDDGPPGTRISLRAGDKYQFFDPHAKLLTLSSRPRLKNTSIDINPLLALFSFAYTGNSYVVVSTFRDPQTWENVRKLAKWQGFETLQGHRCAVISFEVRTHGMSMINKTYFAEDLGYYPVHIESRTAEGTIVGQTTGSKFQQYHTEDGTIFIPTHVSILGHDRKGKHFQTIGINVDANSLQINHPIPDELFEIPPSYADSIFDADIGLMYRFRGGSPIFEEPVSASLDPQLESQGRSDYSTASLLNSRREPNSTNGKLKQESDKEDITSVQSTSSFPLGPWLLLALGLIILSVSMSLLYRRFMLMAKEKKNGS